MIYGDFLRENTLTIDNSIILLDEEFNSFNKIVEATNILINESILNEGSNLNILKLFLEKVIDIIKKIKDFIVRFIKEKIKKLEEEINTFKERDTAYKLNLQEVLKEITRELFDINIKSELNNIYKNMSNNKTDNEEVDTKIESASLLKETNNLSNCVFIELVNENAIKNVSNLFDEFLNIIGQKYDPKLFNNLINKINTSIDTGSLVFSFKEKMIGINDWVEPRIYDQIFEFVKSNYDISNQIVKKLGNLESIYKSDLNNLKDDQNYGDLNKAIDRQRLELSIKIIDRKSVV